MGLSGLSQAQTKRIFHKSHSGSSKTFTQTISVSLFNNGTSSFGKAPDISVKSARLDSLIALDDGTVVMVTTACYTSRSKKIKISKKWKPGREILYQHPYFSKPNSVKSMREIIDKEYHFTNPASSVVFVGFPKP